MAKASRRAAHSTELASPCADPSLALSGPRGARPRARGSGVASSRSRRPRQDSTVAARRGLIEQAQSAREQGEHLQALDFARRAAQLGSSASLRRFIAEEEEALGLPAEALGSAELCAREGAHEPAQAAHVEVCRAIAARAKDAVAHVVLRVAPDVDGGHVLVRGAEVPRARWGAPYVVSPGTLTVEATAPGFIPYRAEVDVARGAIAEVAIMLHPAQLAEPRTSEPPPAPSRPEVERAAPSRRLSPLVFVGAGTAIVASGVALGVGLAANASLRDYESRCAAPGAAPTCAGERDRLQGDLDTRALIVNVAVAVAVAGAAACVIGLLTGGSSSPRTAKTLRGGVLMIRTRRRLGLLRRRSHDDRRGVRRPPSRSPGARRRST